MIKKSLVAATVASGLVVPAAAGIYIPPKPSIVKPENLDFSKNILAMPLTLGMLPGKAPPVTVNNRNTTSNATTTGTQTTYSYTGVSFGTANTTRCVIAFILGYNGSTGGRTLSSCTLGGVTATIVAQQTTGSGLSLITAIAIARVPTGTTGTVSTSYSNSMNQNSVRVYSYNDIISTTAVQTSTINMNVSGVSSTITSFPYGGLAVAFATTQNTSATYTFTGVTERADDVTSAWKIGIADGFPGSTITCTPTAVTRGSLVCATFR